MADKNLVNQIRSLIDQGYSSKRIEQSLISQGWTKEEVDDAARSLIGSNNPIEKWSGKPDPKPMTLQTLWPLFVVVGVIVGGLVVFFIIMSEPECGNGVKEAGETYETCCEDAGCFGDQSCIGNSCIDPECGYCQYLSNYRCKDYACCDDSDCADNDPLSIDICENPGLLSARCTNEKEDQCEFDYECNDRDPYTDDVCTGTPMRCVFTPIPECSSGDGYCPPGCDNAVDNDCEIADQCSSNYDCNDNDDSTNDVCAGIPKECTNTLITSCLPGDGYCPAGCESPTDNDCEVVIIDCGSNLYTVETMENMPNYDCFIAASENCDKTKLSNTYILEILGMISTGTTFMEIRGLDGDKCVYYERIDDSGVEFSDEMIQQMLDNNVTQEQIDQQEELADETAKTMIGNHKTCKFTLSDLTEMLNRWRAGMIFSADFSVAECVCSHPGDAACN